MEFDYDIFELSPDHTLRWRTSVRGTQLALETLHALAEKTVNELFVTELGTQEIVARVNDGPRLS